MRRSDPRRIAVLGVLVLGAVVYAIGSADHGWSDVLRFLAGALTGCLAGIAIRRLDDRLTARTTPGDAERLAGIARQVGPVIGVAIAVAVAAAGGVYDSAAVWLAGAFAGMLLTVGVLYPLPQRRG